MLCSNPSYDLHNSPDFKTITTTNLQNIFFAIIHTHTVSKNDAIARIGASERRRRENHKGFTETMFQQTVPQTFPNVPLHMASKTQKNQKAKRISTSGALSAKTINKTRRIA